MLKGIGQQFKKFAAFGKQRLQQGKISKYIRGKMDQAVIAQRSNLRSKTIVDIGSSTKSQARDMIAGINNRYVNAGLSASITTPTSTGRKLVETTRKRMFSTAGSMSNQIILGATAMAGISFMNGGMSQAQDIMYERYMRDSRYSSKLLTQTNLGQASGNGSLNMGNHTGLSLSLSKTRHGR